MQETRLDHVPLLNDFFEYLNANADYVVLRNYENLPYEYGNDIDFLIDEKNLQKSVDELEKIVSKYGFKISKIIYKFHYCGVLIDINGVLLRIDLFTGITKKWFFYGNTNFLLKNRLAYNNFYIPMLEHEIAVIVFKELLTYGVVREKYHDYLNDRISLVQTNKVIEFLKPYFSEKIILSVVESIQNESIYSEKIKFLPKINQLMKFREFIQWIYLRVINA
jgi:hypothetical protein